MPEYSLIPASVTSNIKHGTCYLSPDGNINIKLDIYSAPDKDNVYKASACSIDNSFSPVNLGTFMTETNSCHLVSTTPPDTQNTVIVVYLKDTKTQYITVQSYCVLNDNPIADISVRENEAGDFEVLCTFEDEDEETHDDCTSPLENAKNILDDYATIHPPSDTSLKINEKYYHKLMTELEDFEPFLWSEDTFKWYKITSFTIPSNLSSVKYVLFDTLSINAFDTHKHYLFGVKSANPSDESYYIAVALPSVSNPLSHLNGYFKKISYNEDYDYYTVFIELAPDGQYFLETGNEI